MRDRRNSLLNPPRRVPPHWRDSALGIAIVVLSILAGYLVTP
jgi:hypothetical protein